MRDARAIGEPDASPRKRRDQHAAVVARGPSVSFQPRVAVDLPRWEPQRVADGGWDALLRPQYLTDRAHVEVVGEGGVGPLDVGTRADGEPIGCPDGERRVDVDGLEA